jgi:N,N'-diacetyllegionaminate synthase
MTFKEKKIYIIAEIGVNHNGNISLAKRMMNQAKKAGADAVKFQNFTASSLTTKNAKKAPYQINNTKNMQSQHQMLKNLELRLSDYFVLKKHAQKIKVDFFTSIFDESSIDFLKKKLKQKVLKIPSGELNNTLITEKLNIKDYNIILSTGMANMAEIAGSLNSIFKKEIYKIKNNNIMILDKKFLNKIKKKITLFHCVTDYPVENRFANLSCIQTLSKVFKIPVGYSDHTQGIIAPVIAVSLGAKMIEKHFTLDKNMVGPDHKASLEPYEFSQMVRNIRNYEIMIGNGVKKLEECEKKNVAIARKSIIAKNYIKKGEKFTLMNLTTKRPGNGLSPNKIKKIIGKKSKYNFKPDNLIKL